MTSRARERWLTAYRVACGFLLGTMLFFTFGVAQSLFGAYPREMAGQIATALFPAYYRFLYLGAGMTLLCLALSKPRGARGAAVLLILCALTLLGVEHILTPIMHAAKEMGDKARFGMLHGISMLLNFIAILAVVTATIWPKSDAKG